MYLYAEMVVYDKKKIQMIFVEYGFNFTLEVKHMYTNPKSQRNSELFCKFCTSLTCMHLNVSINIMPSYLSIASNISFNHQCLELEETTNFVEVGCLKKRIAW